jgi:hypothetical protein
MKNLDDVIQWFNQNDFMYNALLTIIIVGKYEAVTILSILVFNNKNRYKLSSFKSRGSITSYLRED